MRWCRSCILPDTRPNLVIGADGICNACRAHGQRPEIDWTLRSRAFREVVAHAKAHGSRYDCLIPVSGGKDSTWQVVTCLDAGLKPLAVTWRTPGRTSIGQANLDNLIRLGVDHIDYSINPKVEARFMLKAFARFGSTAIPMHLALFNIPLTIAQRFEIPLVVWGENSAFEYGSADESHTGFRLDRTWLSTYGVTHGTTAADWIDDDLDRQDLAAYFGPDPDSLQAQGIHAVFLGYYQRWDPQTSFDVAKRYGFQAAPSARTGLYDYADIDDDFISIHHWMKWYKFGFTRLFDNLSLEIRNGRMARDEAIAAVRTRGDDTPYQDIRKFCDFAGVAEAAFFDLAERFRNLDIWTKRDGVWVIRDFLLPNWDWKAAA
jgi:N-acetyl sugar amidotransferase